MPCLRTLLRWMLIAILLPAALVGAPILTEEWFTGRGPAWWTRFYRWSKGWEWRR